LLLDVWLKASEELMRELAPSEEKGETVQNWQQLLQVWSSVFDGAFLQRSVQKMLLKFEEFFELSHDLQALPATAHGIIPKDVWLAH
jgi:hypothetical protein